MKYESTVPLTVISPEDSYHYFFGYYDLQPFDKAGKRHLTHRTTFADRIPEENDTVELGYIDQKMYQEVNYALSKAIRSDKIS